MSSVTDFAAIGQKIGELLAEAKAKPHTIASPRVDVSVDTKGIAEAIGGALKGIAASQQSVIDAARGDIASILAAIGETKAEPFTLPSEIIAGLNAISAGLAAIEFAPVDVTPIADALDRNTAAIAENTKALREQLSAMKADKSVTYDEKGRVTRIIMG